MPVSFPTNGWMPKSELAAMQQFSPPLRQQDRTKLKKWVMYQFLFCGWILSAHASEQGGFARAAAGSSTTASPSVPTVTASCAPRWPTKVMVCPLAAIAAGRVTLAGKGSGEPGAIRVGCLGRAPTGTQDGADAESPERNGAGMLGERSMFHGLCSERSQRAHSRTMIVSTSSQ